MPLPFQVSAQQNTTLIYVERSEPDSLDPDTGTYNPERTFYEGVYEGLLQFNKDTLQVEPRLATSWSHSADGLHYTFVLRRGVKFHDGTTMDAAAVKYSFERTKRVGLGFAFVIKSVVSVDVVNNSTVRINLANADPTFISGVPLVYIVSPTSFGKNEKANDLGKAWATTNEAGTGPYRLDSWVKNQQMVLVAFPDYWGGWRGPHLSRIIIQSVAESATQRELLERGAAQLADTIEQDDLVAIKSNPKLRILENRSLREFYLILNTTKPPLSDIRMRNAMAAVVDQKTLAEKILQGHATVPRGVLPPIMPYFDKTIPELKQDLGLAKTLVTQAGYSNRDITLRYVYFAPYAWQRINGELMMAALAPMGVKMRIEGLPFTTLAQEMFNADTRPDFTASGSSIATPDPDVLLFPWFRSGSNYFANNGYKNPDVDRLLDAARTTLDTGRRAALYSQLQHILMQEMPVIPLTILNDDKVAALSLKGYKFDPVNSAAIDMYGLYFEGR